MKITNLLNLPDPIVLAVTNDPYTKGGADISVTGLIAPARQRALQAAHDDDIVEDVTDRLFSIFGQIGHGILERSEAKLDNPNVVFEDRLFMKRGGWSISGAFDRLLVLLIDRLLQDYKFSGVFQVQKALAGNSPDWEAQLNMYRLLIWENLRVDVTTLEIVVLIRDWQKSRAKADANYPQAGAEKIAFRAWPFDEIERYVADRVSAHQAAAQYITTGNAHFLPACTDEEMWKAPDEFRVFKGENIKATSRHETEGEALAWAEQAVAEFEEKEAARVADKPRAKAKPAPEYRVAKTVGESRRCAGYCNVAAFCSQRKSIKPLNI